VLASLDPILLDLALLFGLSVAVVVAFHRIRIPPIIGFLVVGAVVGPKSLGLVSHQAMVDQLAEVGVVVLLFTVGMELSLQQLKILRRAVVLGGSLQIGLTIALGALVAWIGGLDPGPAFFLGFLLALSSTAAVTKLLTDQGALRSPTGKLSISILLAQDLAVVPLILLLPLLAGREGGVAAVLLDIGESLVWLLVVVSVAFVVVPRALDLVARSRSREAFVLTLITLCLAVAVATAHLGMSLALGAFLAGMVIAGSDYRHQAASEIEPLRDALSGLFFVSIGMLFDPGLIVADPLAVTVAFAAVVVGKALIVFAVAKALNTPTWVSLRASLLLAQVGEFSFVLVTLGRGEELLPGKLEGIFLVVAVLSIAATPLLYAGMRRLTARRTESEREAAARHGLQDHVVIVGYGPGGRTLARALTALEIPFVVLEMNAATVKAERANGVPIEFGDATRAIVLKSVGIQRARLLVLAIPDTEAVRRTVTLAQRLHPGLHIVARANFIGEVPRLFELGVAEVVPQELETSVEILARVLRFYLVPDDEVGRQVRAVRQQHFGLFRASVPPESDPQRLSDFVPRLGFEIHNVEAGAAAAGRTLAELDLRRASACTVVARKSPRGIDVALSGDTRLEAGDVVVLLGPQSRLAGAAPLFRSPHRAEVVRRPGAQAVQDGGAATV
jgi:CPA2 family monovalent cation:H+ antiporter-2